MTMVTTRLPAPDRATIRDMIRTGMARLNSYGVTSCHTDDLLDQLQTCVRQHFPVSVEHSTFQLEPASHTSHENDTHA